MVDFVHFKEKEEVNEMMYVKRKYSFVPLAELGIVQIRKNVILKLERKRKRKSYC